MSNEGFGHFGGTRTIVLGMVAFAATLGALLLIIKHLVPS